jgi:quercetin dioxygenase-like cupin family protein
VKRTVLLQHDTSAPGFEAILVAVEIPVGGREGRHFHPGTAMIHVTDGAITLDLRRQADRQVQGWRLVLRGCQSGARGDQ